MMSRRLILFFLLIVAVVVSAVTIDTFRNKNDKEEEVVAERSEGVALYFAELLYGIYLNEGEKLNDASVYWGTGRDSAINLSSIADENHYLVFRFSGFTCEPCILFVVEKLKRHFPDFQTNHRIILLASNVPDRLKNDYYGKPIYSIPDDHLLLPIDQHNVPYMFVMDSQMECKLLFVPESLHPKLTDFYLKTVKERFFMVED